MSGLFRIWVDRSAEDSMDPSTASVNSCWRSGLAENCSSVLLLTCCCRVGFPPGGLPLVRRTFADLLGRVQRDLSSWCWGGGGLFVVGEVVELHTGEVDLVAELLVADGRRQVAQVDRQLLQGGVLVVDDLGQEVVLRMKVPTSSRNSSSSSNALTSRGRPIVRWRLCASDQGAFMSAKNAGQPLARPLILALSCR
jgi:hypothetical protein